VLAGEAGIDVTPGAPLGSFGEAVAEDEVADNPVESVVDAVGETDTRATEDTPLTLTGLPPAAAVEEAPDESVDEDPDESVDEDPDESVDEDPEFEESVLVVVVEEPEVPPLPLLLPLLFTAPIDNVQVLTSRTAALPLLSVIGVSVMTHVCVISPAGVEVVDWVITVVVCPSDWRLMTTGIAFAGERARKRQ